jgi:hypothetical protein
MRARHWISRLLSRQGLVYSGGNASTEAHYTWLHRKCSNKLASQAPTRSAARRLTLDRRNLLDARMTALAGTDRYEPAVPALMCVFAEPRCCPFLPNIPRARLGRRVASPRPAPPTPAACWLRRPGITACAPAGRQPIKCSGSAVTTGSTGSGSSSKPGTISGHRQRRCRPRTGWLVLAPRRSGATGTAMHGWIDVCRSRPDLVSPAAWRRLAV